MPLYKNEKPEDAEKAYDAVIQNSNKPLEKADAFYNKGVVLQNSKKLAECIDAYKNSLRLNPRDEDARLNLQKALQQSKRNRTGKRRQKGTKGTKETKG
jgi:tetratricopeptide (TPR) repeat protein